MSPGLNLASGAGVGVGAGVAVGFGVGAGVAVGPGVGVGPPPVPPRWNGPIVHLPPAPRVFPSISLANSAAKARPLSNLGSAESVRRKSPPVPKGETIGPGEVGLDLAGILTKGSPVKVNEPCSPIGQE